MSPALAAGVLLSRPVAFCFLPTAFWLQRAYNTRMVKKPASTIEVNCPCCHSRLTVDPQLAAVLSHVPPPRVAPDVDISDAARILSDQAQRREDKFRDS